MNSLLILLIIIITLSIAYLYYRNLQYNKILESFDNTQSSLSTYYQNTVNYDKYQTDKNIYNKVKTKKNLPHSPWNSIWKNDGSSIYGQTILLNDKLILGLSNSSLSQIVNETQSDESCPPNLLLGICQLNQLKNIFTLKKILCNNYTNSSLNLAEGKLSGAIKDKTLTLYSNGISTQIQLTIDSPITYESSTFYKQSNFVKMLSPYVSDYPIVSPSKYSTSNYICTTGTPCQLKNAGFGPSFNDMDTNACGTTQSASDNTCVGNPICVFYSPAPQGFTTCQYATDTFDYMNFPAFTAMTAMEGNRLQTCSYLNYFDKKFNSAILCYVTDIGIVQSLNYEFFGAMENESALTMQVDIMNEVLNTKGGLLEKIRIAIASINKNNMDQQSNGTSNSQCTNNYGTTDVCCGQGGTQTDPQYICPKDTPICSNYIYDVQWGTCTNPESGESIVSKALSFTNFMEYTKNPNNISNMQKSALLKSKLLVKNYNRLPTNSKLYPAVWQINYKNSDNLNNSCTFTLSTSELYNTPVKYAEFKKDGTSGLSFYGGGSEQNLILENSVVLTSDSNTNTVMMTGNIKTDKGLYLIPSMEKNGFSSHSSLVTVTDKPLKNGKWLIIGINLKKIEQLELVLNAKKLAVGKSLDMKNNNTMNYVFTSSNLKGTQLKNTSSGSYDATLINGPTVNNQGPKNNIYAINFNAALQQYVQINASTIGSSGLSYSCWIKVDPSNGEWARIFDFGNGADSDNILIGITGSSLTLSLYLGDTVSYQPTIPGFTVNNNNWYFIAWTLSTSGQWNFYINGTLSQTYQASYPNQISRSSQYLGKSNWSSDPYFTGSIANFVTYNSVLSASQVNNIYLQ